MPESTLAGRILATATAERLDALLDTLLDAVPGADGHGDDAAVRATRADLHHKLAGLRDVVGAVAAPGDEPELVRALAAFALELRCEWERHNLRMAYAWAHADAAPAPATMLAASATSGMFAWLEEILPAGALSALAESASALIERVRADLVSGALFPSLRPVA